MSTDMQSNKLSSSNHINSRVAQWLSHLLQPIELTYSDVHTNQETVKKIQESISDAFIWNNLQNFLYLIAKQAGSVGLTVSSNSLLANVVNQGFVHYQTTHTVNKNVSAAIENLKHMTFTLPSAKYKTNFIQVVAPFNNEIVINHFIELSEQEQLPENNKLLNDAANMICKLTSSTTQDIQPELEHQSILLDVNNLAALDTAVTFHQNQSTIHKEAKTPNMPNFQIPNAKVKQPYQATIKSTRTPTELLQITDVLIPEELGLRFNPKDALISGMPLVDGEFQLNFQYLNNLKEKKSDTCLLIVNPDPKSLWQINEPDIHLPYQKKHQEKQYLQQPNYQLIACSRRGRSHEHAGSFRDDDFYISPIQGFDDWSIMIVADGAGSAKYSREGSRLAVTVTGEMLQQQLSKKTDLLTQIDDALTNTAPGQINAVSQQAYQTINALLNPVFQEAINAALTAIETEAQKARSDIKDFATTLLISLNRQRDNQTFITSFWMGDGAIAVYIKDKIRLMGKPDGGQYAGQTSFLSRSFASNMNERMRMGYYADVDAIILMTDGISDPLFETDAGLEQQARWDKLWSEVKPLLGQEHPDELILEWMHFLIAGHHDDRTIAILQPRNYTLAIQQQSPWVKPSQESHTIKENSETCIESNSETHLIIDQSLTDNFPSTIPQDNEHAVDATVKVINQDTNDEGDK